MNQGPAADAQLWRLLRALDRSGHLERPPDYDHARTRARFDQLAGQLDATFGCRCAVDRNVQDASLHGRIDLPAAATATGRPLAVHISNFGGLAVVTVDNPGVWTDEEATALLHPDDARRIRSVLADLEYTLLPEEPLWRHYDGAATLLSHTPTWWIRFFDYL